MSRSLIYCIWEPWAKGAKETKVFYCCIWNFYEMENSLIFSHIIPIHATAEKFFREHSENATVTSLQITNKTEIL